MSTRRQRSKGALNPILNAEQIPGFRIGDKIGKTAFEIWQSQSLDYVCLLQVNAHGKWAATHNMCLPDNDSRFKHSTPLDALQWYQALRTKPVKKTPENRVYRYRGLPANIAPNEELWCVSGRDKIGGGAGVLEWCHNEKDAQMVLKTMRETQEFEHLQAQRYTEAFPRR